MPAVIGHDRDVVRPASYALVQLKLTPSKMRTDSSTAFDRPQPVEATPNTAPIVAQNRIASLFLYIAVAGAPFPFGSTSPTAIAVWCIVLGLSAVTISPRNLQRGHLLLLGGIGLIILFYAFVLHEQLSHHPWVATPHPIWAQASEVLGVHLTPSVSIVRSAPLYALGAPLAAVLALITGLIIGSDRARARQFLNIIAWAGAAYAVYGILSFLIEPTMILWREKTAYVGNVTSTFINRNSAAAYFGSSAAVWLLLLLEQVRRQLPAGPIAWKTAHRHILSATPRTIIISFSMMFLCLMAMFLTGSRAGVVLSLLSLIAAFTIYFRRDLPPRTGVWISIAGGAAVALTLLQFMGGVVSSRFDAQGLADEGRIEAYRSTLRMIADRPWFGTGLGTYAWAFPAYRSPLVSMRGVWDMAHSTPLELAEEVGVPLAASVAVGWIVMLSVLMRGIAIRQRDTIIPLAAFSVSIIAILHSCVDFSLQIPGYAIGVFALVGIGLAQSFRTRATGLDGQKQKGAPAQV